MACGTHKNISTHFVGATHGWFGDFSGGLDPDELDVNGAFLSTTPLYTETIIFNQRRFFVFFSFVILASSITTGVIGERVTLKSTYMWVIF